MSAFDTSFSFEMARVREQGETLPPIGGRISNQRVNFDGLLYSTPAQTGGVVAYTQLFRNGIIEAVDCGRLAPVALHPQRPNKVIPSVAYERDIVHVVTAHVNFYKKFELPPPVLVGVSILNYDDTGNWKLDM